MFGADDIIMGGAGLVGGLIKGLVGGGQKRQGKKLLNSLQYPTEQLPSEITENQNLARQQAATGLPSEQYANAMKNIQRSQLMALRGAHDRRGGLGAVSGIQQNTNDATLNLDSQDAQMKIANQRNLIGVNNQVAGWKSKLFDSNVRDKYNRDYNYAQGLIGYGNQNKFAGVDQAIGGLGSAASGLFGMNGILGNKYAKGTKGYAPTQKGSLLDNGLPMGNYQGEWNGLPG